MERLPLPVVADVFRSLAHFFPKILLAAVIAFVGARAGSLTRQLVTGVAERTGMAHAQALGRVAQTAVTVVAFILCVQQVGLDSRVFASLLPGTVLCIIGGMALAFGLGSGPIVTNILPLTTQRELIESGKRSASGQSRAWSLRLVRRRSYSMSTETASTFQPASTATRFRSLPGRTDERRDTSTRNRALETQSARGSTSI